MEEGHEPVERCDLLLHAVEGVGGLVRLGDFGVGQPLDDLHRRRRGLRLAQRTGIEQLPAAPGCGPVDAVADPQAEQAIARAQVMVDERQRRAGR